MPARRFPAIALLVLTFPLYAADWQYLTVPGDTLIGIGRQYLKNPNDWPRVQAENKVDIPEHLPSNTHLRIPVNLLKVTPAPAEVTAVTGNVRVKAAAGGFQPLKPGDRLSGGESVLTGPRSSASYRFADGTALTQQAGAKLVFGRLAAYGKTGMVSTEINLEAGRLEASAGKQVAPAGGFSVRTPVAVAGLRGTEFRLNVSDDGKRMSNEVTEGTVGVSAKGKSVKVEAGYGTVAEAGRPPAVPRELLPAPRLAIQPGVFERGPVQFSKTPQPGAVAWRAQVASDAAFRAVLLDDVFTADTAQWEETLPDGDYFLRIRGIDAAGLEGFAASYPFTVDIHPMPPVPVAPALGERLYQLQANIAWSAVPDARGYLLQLAPTPEFGNGVIERRLPPVIQHQETLAEGEWHWRVASLDEAGRPHLFSPHRAFIIKPLPAPPGGAQSRVDDGRAHFTWQAVRGADRYGFEVAKDDQTTIVAREQAREPSLATSLTPGKYYWRVRGEEASGQAGDWGGQNVVILPPAPPTQLKADAQAHPVALSWRGEARQYLVEVAADAAFTRLVARLEAERPSALLPELEPGDYHARVIAVGAEGASSLPSAPVGFTVEHTLPWWLLLLPLLATL